MDARRGTEIIDLTEEETAHDEAIARELQRQLNGEVEAGPSIPAAESGTRDEAFPRALQAEMDAEYSSQQQQSHEHYGSLDASSRKRKHRTSSSQGEEANAANPTPTTVSASSEFESLLQKQCNHCKNSLLPTKETAIMQQFKSLHSALRDEAASLSGLGAHISRSSRCNLQHCFGRGEDIDTDQSSLQLGSVRVHCNGQRLALVCILLCGYDTLAKHNKPGKAKKAKSKQSSSRSSAPSGTGYGGSDYRRPAYRGGRRGRGGLGGRGSRGGYASGNHGWDEYGSDDGETPDEQPDQQPNIISDKEDEDDKLAATIMETIADLLPSFVRFDNEFDMVPPPALAAFLAESTILDKAAELLCNNSLEDISSRMPLYHALIRFVRALSGHFATANLVFQQRISHQLGHSLLKVVLQSDTSTATDKTDTTQSLAFCMKDLAHQCIMVLKDPSSNSEEDVAMQLFHSIQSMAEDVQANAGATQSSQQQPDSWQKALVVKEIPDHDIMSGFCFSTEANKMTANAPARMKSIFSEITTLHTTLPDGIFVRYAESRMDCMKILMVGPQDTPYADGLFEFDLLCPHDYSNSPPKMHLKTTGRGTVRFNPNLYANGKVCLSLLGT